MYSVKTVFYNGLIEREHVLYVEPVLPVIQNGRMDLQQHGHKSFDKLITDLYLSIYLYIYLSICLSVYMYLSSNFHSYSIPSALYT